MPSLVQFLGAEIVEETHLMHDIFSWWKDKNIVTRHSRHTRHTQFKTFTIAQ